MPLTVLTLDAAGWRNSDDLWSALLPALGAPEWHGQSLDALFDSLVARLNVVGPPLVVAFQGISRATPAAIAYATRVREVFADAAAETGEEFALRLD